MILTLGWEKNLIIIVSGYETLIDTRAGHFSTALKANIVFIKSYQKLYYLKQMNKDLKPLKLHYDADVIKAAKFCLLWGVIFTL